MKKVLIYPCGTEIALEMFRSLKHSIHYELYGGSCSYDHGRFVFKKHIDNLPFITDKSNENDIKEFNKAIANYKFDFILPAMDGVLTVFSKYANNLTPIVIAPNYATTNITRSKRNSYKLFRDLIPTPMIFDDLNKIEEYPVFVKPDIGQGSVGTHKVNNKQELDNILQKQNENVLILEYLPGKEYTIDCFTNSKGELIYSRGRERKRIKNGISVNAIFCDRPEFKKYAKIINENLQQRGGWFFQLKEDINGNLKLLEIASRIAGTSAIVRNSGVNLPLLTLDTFNNILIDKVIINNFPIELDRALENTFKTELEYDTVYVDYDDTLVENGKVNLDLIKFLYQCVNKQKKLILLTKHIGDLDKELKQLKLSELFHKIIHIEKNQSKKDFIIANDKAIFIDDSYGERKIINNNFGYYVFDSNMIECLME